MIAAFRSELLLLNRFRMWAFTGLVTIGFTASATALLITTAEPAAQADGPIRAGGSSGIPLERLSGPGGATAAVSSALMAVTTTLLLIGLAAGAATSAIVAPSQDIDTAGWFGIEALQDTAIDFAQAIGWAFAWALIATTLAVLVRSIPAALGIGVLWFGPIENVIGDQQDVALRWFPGLLIQQVTSPSPDSTSVVTTSSAVATLTAYALAMLVLLGIYFNRLDVTS